MTGRSKLKVSSRLLRKKSRKSSFNQAKHCRFCAGKDHEVALDYKNASLLRNFLTERGKILPSRISANCSKHQRVLTNEIKKARVMALLPYSALSY